ncbi:MAG: RNA-directed DNA polymerase [Sphingobacteriales bacterium JAD_PAG50586_3]|nr:MAG: RNA-directed DNA polymerase [Sphingobacteriales bacterium JAD_PAG50586_3]
MSKIKIDKDDKARVILTELLPYEVPMLFSNDGFHSILKNKGKESIISKIKLANSKDFSIPFNYEIRKNDGDSRTLSIIHPFKQIDFIDFYSKYDSLILHLCSKSPFSLRRVSSVAKYYYSASMVFNEDTIKAPGAEIEPEVLDTETQLLKSYFTYYPIDLIHKFFDKREYIKLEQRFNQVLEFDLSKCFYHIYTHSLTWAVKGKEEAKSNANKETFENDFDKLMQKANYNETNGIIVGPEVSRIFAEIILQQIDLDVLKILESNKVKLKYGVDFDIKRYVDDYFIFANDEKILDQILIIYKKQLECYKLYVNTAKTQKRKVPFISNIAIAKREIGKLDDRLFKELFNDFSTDVSLNKIKNPYAISNNFIKEFQAIVKQNELTYETISKEVIRNLKKMLIYFIKNIKIEDGKAEVESFLMIVLDISFYAYSLCINASTTFKISQIIVLACKYIDGNHFELKYTIHSKIAKESDFAMTIFNSRSKPTDTNIDTLNLLISLRKLDDSYLLNESRLKELFRIESALDYLKLNYFQIVTLLYYIRNESIYSDIKNELQNCIEQKFLADGIFTQSELTLLFLDVLTCPFIEDKLKNKIVRHTKLSRDVKAEAQLIVDQISDSYWFMDWDIDIDLEGVLKKKEWGSSY